MTTSVYWTVHAEDNSYVVNAITSDWPSTIIGGRGQVRVWVDESGSLTVGSGETYTVAAETAEFYDTVTVEDSGTLTVEDDAELVVGEESSRWNDLAEYVDYAGHYAPMTGVNHVQRFREQLPADARVPSVVLGFEPSPTLKDRGVNGVWGLIDGGSDERNNVLTNYQFQFDLLLLDRFSEYGSVNAVKSDLEA